MWGGSDMDLLACDRSIQIAYHFQCTLRFRIPPQMNICSIIGKSSNKILITPFVFAEF